jgi:hypothetical protein
MYIGLLEKIPVILVRCNLNFLDKVFEKYSNIQFYENRFSGN